MLWTNEERTSAGEGGVKELRDNGMESVRGTSESEAERGGGGVSRRTELGELEKCEGPTKKDSYLMSRNEDFTQLKYFFFLNSTQVAWQNLAKPYD